ncbi:MAG: alpha/beta fold hydrolase [Deltaproteobacteria bacterium]|nr:alpha/beta fold hydrolase [Deltaproteobacteria bacterium]
MKTDITIKSGDGRSIRAVKYDAQAGNGSFIVLNSALGIRQGFYADFALFLVSLGYEVLTWDARGIGGSAFKDPKSDMAKLRDWPRLDLKAVLNFVVDQGFCEWKDLTLIGHSAGAHLVGLCPSILKIPRIMMIAAGTCYWRLYAPKLWPKTLLSWYVLVPLMVQFLGYVPANLGIGHDLPKGIISEWRDWSLKKDYLFSDETLVDTFYQKYSGKILSIGFSDDAAFSPEKTVYDLMAHFPNAEKKTQILRPEDLGMRKIGHFGFFKKSSVDSWRLALSRWLRFDD